MAKTMQDRKSDVAEERNSHALTETRAVPDTSQAYVPFSDETDAPSLPTHGPAQRMLVIVVISVLVAMALALGWAYATRKNAWPDLTPPASTSKPKLAP